eukprot:TRINITY_DN33985_c0_g1_i1.p1 TRINITY_DN33985_c0_g1~~TRINITY_DN33985_c0_g1_i1.p1  ORF type:complete len:977 (-),score=238.20 TRINITY_DN33985_c0_g1_i1:40-2820(-)
MDIGKRMMEKWGWQKGQGLGKHQKGITSCLTLTKQAGSSTQGRIEQEAAPMNFSDPILAAAASATKADDGKAHAEAASLLQSVGAELGVEMPDNEVEPEAKRQRRSKWEAEGPAVVEEAPGSALALPQQEAPVVPQMATPAPAVYFDVDPRDAEAAKAAVAAQQASVANATSVADVAAAATEEPQSREVESDPVENPSFPRMPTHRVRVRQFVRDDWRWSKGFEALRMFEEVSLPEMLLTLAKKILGEGSRYPARIADDTDCVVEVTAWKTLLVRPRGSGAKVELAKRMLYEVLHPHSHELREDALLTPEEMARAAQADEDPSVINLEGDDETTRRMREGLARTHGKLNRVGIGADEEVQAEGAVLPDVVKTEAKEMDLANDEDASLVKGHLEDLRVATGVASALTGRRLKLMGKDKNTRKAMQLIKTLVETGEWVALTEGFVPSQESKEKRRALEGPVEQLLLKVPEGMVVKKIEKHIKAMERASDADKLMLTSKPVAGKRTLTEGFVPSQESKEKRRALEGPVEQLLLKVPEGMVVKKIEKHIKAMERASDADKLMLTSKPVAGKRTLMVEGTRAAHERVKLMVKELTDKGASPMLTKALGHHRTVTGGPNDKPVVVAASAAFMIPPPRNKLGDKDPHFKTRSLTPSRGGADAPGVVSAAPVLRVKVEDDGGVSMEGTSGMMLPVTEVKEESDGEATDPEAEQQPQQPLKKPKTSVGFGMRNMPAPRLAVAMGQGEDLFAGLPAPATAPSATVPAAVVAASAPTPATATMGGAMGSTSPAGPVLEGPPGPPLGPASAPPVASMGFNGEALAGGASTTPALGAAEAKAGSAPLSALSIATMAALASAAAGVGGSGEVTGVSNAAVGMLTGAQAQPQNMLDLGLAAAERELLETYFPTGPASAATSQATDVAAPAIGVADMEPITE